MEGWEDDDLTLEPDWEPPEEPGRVPPPAPGFAGEEVEEPVRVDFPQAVADTQASIEDAYRLGERTGQPMLAPMVEQPSLPEPPAIAELDRHRTLENSKAQAQQDRIDIRRARKAGDPAEADRIIRERRDRERHETGGALSDTEILQRHAAGQWDDTSGFPDFSTSEPSTGFGFTTPYEEPQGTSSPSRTSPYEPATPVPPPVPGFAEGMPEPPKTGSAPADRDVMTPPWEMPGSPGGVGSESNQQIVELLQGILTTLQTIEEKLDLQSRW